MAAVLLLAAAGAAGATETVSYDYDPLGRLVRVERTGTVNNGFNANYTFDCAGNRANVTAGPGVPPPSPPAACSAAAPPPPPPGNQPPVTAADTASIPKCGTVVKNVIANDTDPESNYPLALTDVSYAGTRGGAALADSASIEFVSSGLSGVASVSYTVRDSFGATSTGTFNVSITTVNSCP
jgi:hypothetical protein